VLYGKLRPNLDKVIVADSPGICSSEIVPISVHGETRPEWIRLVLKRPYFLKVISKLTHGVSLPRLKTKDALNTIHPLPPVEEQDRIIEIVGQLFDLCDDLSDALNQREKNTEEFIQQIPNIKLEELNVG
jgi:type I restriction enzyme S subunit